MRSREIKHTATVWRSEVRPDVRTSERALADVIAWADDHPHAWDIVTQTKSKALGVGSCDYIGWAQRGLSPEAILERVRHLHGLITGRDAMWGPASIFAWRARFTLDHYLDAGFTGGFFRQHDGTFERLCMTLDYTPDTLEEVVSRFAQWCGLDYRTAYVTLNSEIVRLVEGG